MYKYSKERGISNVDINHTLSCTYSRYKVKNLLQKYISEKSVKYDFLLAFAQNLVVSLDCIPDTENTGNPGFLDQEILVSVFFRDQDLRKFRFDHPCEICTLSSKYS